MKLRALLLIFICSLYFNALLAEPPSCTVSDHIIRVRIIAAPEKEILPFKSPVTGYSKSPDRSWNVVPSKESLTLITENLTVIVNLKTGVVSFRYHNGKKMVTEKPIDGRNFQSAVFDGKHYYNLTQTFQTTGVDEWYGSGQHKN